MYHKICTKVVQCIWFLHFFKYCVNTFFYKIEIHNQLFKPRNFWYKNTHEDSVFLSRSNQSQSTQYQLVERRVWYIHKQPKYPIVHKPSVRLLPMTCLKTEVIKSVPTKNRSATADISQCIFAIKVTIQLLNSFFFKAIGCLKI